MSNRIVKIIDREQYRSLIQNKKFRISNHAYDRIMESQRKIFNEKILLNHLQNETPAHMGLQENQRIIVYFRKNKYYLKIILEQEQSFIEIITFMNIDYLPNISK